MAQPPSAGQPNMDNLKRPRDNEHDGLEAYKQPRTADYPAMNAGMSDDLYPRRDSTQTMHPEYQTYAHTPTQFPGSNVAPMRNTQQPQACPVSRMNGTTPISNQHPLPQPPDGSQNMSVRQEYGSAQLPPMLYHGPYCASEHTMDCQNTYMNMLSDMCVHPFLPYPLKATGHMFLDPDGQMVDVGTHIGAPTQSQGQPCNQQHMQQHPSQHQFLIQQQQGQHSPPQHFHIQQQHFAQQPHSPHQYQPVPENPLLQHLPQLQPQSRPQNRVAQLEPHFLLAANMSSPQASQPQSPNSSAAHWLRRAAKNLHEPLPVMIPGIPLQQKLPVHDPAWILAPGNMWSVRFLQPHQRLGGYKRMRQFAVSLEAKHPDDTEYHSLWQDVVEFSKALMDREREWYSKFVQGDPANRAQREAAFSRIRKEQTQSFPVLALAPSLTQLPQGHGGAGLNVSPNTPPPLAQSNQRKTPSTQDSIEQLLQTSTQEDDKITPHPQYSASVGSPAAVAGQPDEEVVFISSTPGSSTEPHDQEQFAPFADHPPANAGTPDPPLPPVVTNKKKLKAPTKKSDAAFRKKSQADQNQGEQMRAYFRAQDEAQAKSQAEALAEFDREMSARFVEKQRKKAEIKARADAQNRADEEEYALNKDAIEAFYLQGGPTRKASHQQWRKMEVWRMRHDNPKPTVVKEPQHPFAKAAKKPRKKAMKGPAKQSSWTAAAQTFMLDVSAPVPAQMSQAPVSLPETTSQMSLPAAPVDFFPSPTQVYAYKPSTPGPQQQAFATDLHLQLPPRLEEENHPATKQVVPQQTTLTLQARKLQQPPWTTRNQQGTAPRVSPAPVRSIVAALAATTQVLPKQVVAAPQAAMAPQPELGPAGPLVSFRARQMAMETVFRQMQARDAAFKEQRELTDAERIIVGGIDIDELLKADTYYEKITKMITPYFEEELRAEDEYVELTDIPILGVDELPEHSQTHFGITSSEITPAAIPAEWQDVIDNATDADWMAIDITAGDEAGLWEALDNLPESFMQEIQDTAWAEAAQEQQDAQDTVVQAPEPEEMSEEQREFKLQMDVLREWNSSFEGVEAGCHLDDLYTATWTI